MHAMLVLAQVDMLIITMSKPARMVRAKFIGEIVFFNGYGGKLWDHICAI